MFKLYNKFEIYLLFIFANLSESTNIYILTPTPSNEILDKGIPKYNQDLSNQSSENNLIVVELLKILNENATPASRNKCARHFGSIYGSVVQKQRCLQMLTNKKDDLKKNNVENNFYIKQKSSDTRDVYVPNTRKPNDWTKFDQNFAYDYLDVRDLGRTDTGDHVSGFSHDYLDISDIYRKQLKDTFKDKDYLKHKTNNNPRDKKDVWKIDNLRKFISINNNTKNESNVKIRADSDSDSDSSSEEVEVKETDGSEGIDNDNESGASEAEESSEIIKKKRQKSSEHVKQSKGYVYMQGKNRIADSDESGTRKRLEHFLPKRFHWDEDDLQNLGYYWFNGPRGKYSWTSR